MASKFEMRPVYGVERLLDQKKMFDPNPVDRSQDGLWAVRWKKRTARGLWFL